MLKSFIAKLTKRKLLKKFREIKNPHPWRGGNNLFPITLEHPPYGQYSVDILCSKYSKLKRVVKGMGAAPVAGAAPEMQKGTVPSWGLSPSKLKK